MDGWITIGTKVDTDKFDKQIRELENKIKKEEQKAQFKLKIKTNAETDLEKHRQDIFELEKEYGKLAPSAEKYYEIVERLNKTGTITGAEAMYTKNLETSGTIKDYEKMGKELDKMYATQNKLKERVEKTKLSYNETAEKVAEYKSKIESINLQKQQYQIDQTKIKMGALGNSVQDIVHKVGKWALALFSIRSLYFAIRQVTGILTQDNELLANQITAIKTSLANALAPVIQFIVDLVSKAVSLVGYILKTLFGIDIFAKQAKSNIKQTTSAVKELRKQLAGFDEINMLNENGTTGALGGLGDIDGVQDAMDNLREQGEKVFKDVKKWLLGSDKNDWEGIWEDNMKTLRKVSEENFGPLANWINTYVWQPLSRDFSALIEKMKPVIEPLKKAFGELFEQIKPLWEPIVKWVNDVIVQPIARFFEPLFSPIYKHIVAFANKVIDVINNMFGVFGIHLDHIETEEEKKVNNMKQHFAGSLEDVELKSQDTENLIKGNFANIEEEADYRSQQLKTHFAGSLDDIQLKALDTENLTNANWANMEEKADYEGQLIKEDFVQPMNDVQDKVNDLSSDTIDIQTDTSNIQNVDNGLDGILSKLWELIKNPWNIRTTFSATIGQSIRDTANTIASMFNSFSLPRMATGGIVNMPNRGTMVGAAMAGESGREGVIPLTDQQAMSELGREIGKNVLVNLTNITTMNGRVISRELKNISNEQDFAFNS